MQFRRLFDLAFFFVKQVLNVDEKHIPPSHFSSLEECQDKIGTLFVSLFLKFATIMNRIVKTQLESRYFTENDPGMDSLCWCTCCKDEKGRHDGCYCPKW